MNRRIVDLGRTYDSDDIERAISKAAQDFELMAVGERTVAPAYYFRNGKVSQTTRYEGVGMVLEGLLGMRLARMTFTSRTATRIVLETSVFLREKEIQGYLQSFYNSLEENKTQIKEVQSESSIATYVDNTV